MLTQYEIFLLLLHLLFKSTTWKSIIVVQYPHFKFRYNTVIQSDPTHETFNTDFKKTLKQQARTFKTIPKWIISCKMRNEKQILFPFDIPKRKGKNWNNGDWKITPQFSDFISHYRILPKIQIRTLWQPLLHHMNNFHIHDQEIKKIDMLYKSPYLKTLWDK